MGFYGYIHFLIFVSVASRLNMQVEDLYSAVFGKQAVPLEDAIDLSRMSMGLTKSQLETFDALVEDLSGVYVFDFDEGASVVDAYTGDWKFNVAKASCFGDARPRAVVSGTCKNFPREGKEGEIWEKASIDAGVYAFVVTEKNWKTVCGALGESHPDLEKALRDIFQDLPEEKSETPIRITVSGGPRTGKTEVIEKLKAAIPNVSAEFHEIVEERAWIHANVDGKIEEAYSRILSAVLVNDAVSIRVPCRVTSTGKAATIVPMAFNPKTGAPTPDGWEHMNFHIGEDGSVKQDHCPTLGITLSNSWHLKLNVSRLRNAAGFVLDSGDALYI